PLPCVPSELLTDSLEMRTTASLIVTMFFGHKEAPPALPAGRWCSRRRCSAGRVLIPRGDFGDGGPCAGLVDDGDLSDHSVGGRPSHGLSVASNPVSSATFPSTMCRTAMFNNRYSGSSGVRRYSTAAGMRLTVVAIQRQSS